MTPERAKALEAVAEAARVWLNVAAELPYQNQQELDSMDACEKALTAYYALPAEPADAGDMVEVQKPKVIAFSEGDDWRTVLFDDGSMFTAMDGGRTWKPIDLPRPVMPVVRAEVET